MNQKSRSGNPFSNVAAGLLLLAASLLYLSYYHFQIRFFPDLAVLALLGLLMMAGLNYAVPVLLALALALQFLEIPGFPARALTNRGLSSRTFLGVMVCACILLSLMIYAEGRLVNRNPLWFVPGLLIVVMWGLENGNRLRLLLQGNFRYRIPMVFQLAYPAIFGLSLLIYGLRFRRGNAAPGPVQSQYAGARNPMQTSRDQTIINGFETEADRHSLGVKGGIDLWDRR